MDDADLLEPEGGPTVPLVVHVPHGGTRIPPAVRRGLLLDDEALEAEVVAMTDWHTPRLFAPPAVAAGGVVLVNRASRLVVDPERLPDAREPMTALGMGAVYTRTSTGRPLRAERDAAERVRLLDGWFLPWLLTMERLVGEALDRWGRCLVLDAHSFPSAPLPYEDATLARPGLCLGHEPYHAPRGLLPELERLAAAHGVDVAHNAPFAGSYVPLRRYRTDKRVTSVMVELNRGGHLDEATGEPGPGFPATRALVADLVAAAAAWAAA